MFVKKHAALRKFIMYEASCGKWKSVKRVLRMMINDKEKALAMHINQFLMDLLQEDQWWSDEATFMRKLQDRCKQHIHMILGGTKLIWMGRLHSTIKIFNTIGHPNRDVIAFASYDDNGYHTIYRYGKGITNRGKWFPVDPSQKATHNLATVPVLSELLRVVQINTGETPNHCIVTRYKSGDDSIDSHHDKIVDIVPGTGIHIISLGASRQFEVSHQDIKSWRQTIQTNNGQLLSMDYDANIVYKHGIRCNTSSQETRISIIFRTMRTWYNSDSKDSFHV